ncbi:hypothetical protein ACIRG5_47145 [Lentzea sp. NPDC102401]|uniref:hypothetical protein n=1 Tax=Lentzea sp. NPDC102401 TaxID=3364128 RepID=UPI003808C531
MALRRRFMLGGVVGAMLLATACTGVGGEQKPRDNGAQQQAEYQVEPAVPEMYKAKALADSKNRAIDACGLHDPEAAQKVTGDQPDEIVPGSSGLNECDLRTHKGEFEATWTFYLEVGTLYDASARRDDAPEKLGGMDVFVSEEERTCTVSKPLDDNYAVQMRASASVRSDEKPAKPACTVAREYVTALAPIWQDMPKHGSGRTKPELTLVKLDPCKAASATLDLFEEAQLETGGPMSCTARSGKVTAPQKRDKGVGRPEVTVAWTMNTDPSKLVKADGDTARAITVDGRKAVLSKGSLGCTTYIVWDDQIKVDQDNRVDDDDLTQQIRVQTATCDNAEEVAKKIVAKVAQR